MTHPAPYLDQATLMALLNPAQALVAVQDFFAHQTRAQVTVPTRIHLPVPGVNTMGLYMPAATGSHVGVKIVHLMPDRRPSIEAEVFLYDAQTGKLLFWGDGKPLTALRTAAVSTAASLALRPSINHLAVYGAGVQAAAHIEAFRDAYPALETITAITRNADSFHRLQALLSPKTREQIRQAGTATEALHRADCIIATTPAPAPLFDWADVPPGCHLVGIGSATPAMNELPAQAFVESQVWVDTDAALHEAGDCIRAKEQGWNPESRAGELFDLLEETDPLPRNDGATMFKSVGHAAQDLAILVRLWELAQTKGLVG